MVELVKNYTKEIVLILGSIVSLISAFKKDVIGSSDRINRGRYQTFKLIKEEYIKDKINGYFAFQNYLNRRVESNLIDFIMISPDAYSIFKRIKAAEGKYTFDGNKFETNISKIKYIFPLVGYMISSFVIIYYLSMSKDLLQVMDNKQYLFLLIILLCFFGPVLINSIQTISTTSDAKYLEKVTQGNQSDNKENNKKGKKRPTTAST